MNVITLVLFILGGVLLIVGAEFLVRGASRLAVAAGLSHLVVGLTVVALGTSAPELAVTVGAAFTGQADVAVGNVIGSNIANVLLILGLSAAVAPLAVRRQLLRLDVPLMIIISLATLVLALDGYIGRLEGIALFLGLVTYITYLVVKSRREEALLHLQADQVLDAEPRKSWLLDVALVMGGLMMLVLGARWLIQGAVAVAQVLGVSELIIGLTIVAVGTSLPELATSVMASLRGERDIAVGNVVGSNLFNLMAVLGLGGVVAPEGMAVARDAITFDIPVMIGVALVCLPIFFTGYEISRWEGGLLLGYYGIYTAYIILHTTKNSALPAFSTVMLYFVIPLTALALTAHSLRALRHRPG